MAGHAARPLAAETFADAVRAQHEALVAFMHRDTEPYKRLLSRRDDTTLANPFGGVARGWEEIGERIDRATTYSAEGEVAEIETLASFASGDLGYTLEIERVRGKVGGLDRIDTVALRTTCVFRLEEDGWRLLHRHADPAVELQGPASIVR